MIVSVSNISSNVQNVLPEVSNMTQSQRSEDTLGLIDNVVKASDLSSKTIASENIFADVVASTYQQLKETSPNSKYLSEKATDSVSDIKAEMIPDFQVETKNNKSSNFDEVLEIVTKSFNHATFVAMVTQVASGVSSSVKMLVRQG